MAKYTGSTTLGAILDDPDMKAVLLQFLPDLEANPMIGMAKGINLEMLKGFVPDADAKAKMEEAIEALKAQFGE